MDDRAQKIRQNLVGDAEAGNTFYYGVVRQKGEWANSISHCQHRHRSREAAERCGERMADEIAAPWGAQPTVQWRS